MRRSRLPFFAPSSLLLLALLPASLLGGCSDGPKAEMDAGNDSRVRRDIEIPPGDPGRILSIEETDYLVLPTLTDEVYVVRTEANVPHVYAKNERDLRVVQGYLVARDRYMQIDLIRRYAMGQLSNLLGTPGLAFDQSNRARGTLELAQRILGIVNEDQGKMLDAFAEGINAYIDAVAAGTAPAPSELSIAAPLLGAPNTEALMHRFNRLDILGFAAGVLFNAGFEDDDLRASNAISALQNRFDAEPNGSLRRSGLIADMMDRVDPVYPMVSAPGFGTTRGSTVASNTRRQQRRRLPHVNREAAERWLSKMEVLAQFHGGIGQDFGSNAWTMTGASTADGSALLASDSHLPMAIPPLYFQMGLDTSVFGGATNISPLSQFGLFFPGIPYMAEGTNGKVAWGNTFQEADATDWYREEIQIDAQGQPQASRFQGEWRPLQKTNEVYEIAGVSLFQSMARTEMWNRFETFDGRHLVSLEGEIINDENPANGRMITNVGGDTLVAKDMDGDGKITAVSVDYVGYDASNLLAMFDSLGRSTSVETFREATKQNVGFTQNLNVIDDQGHAMYTGYNATPCRSYLRPDGQTTGWSAGGNPQRLIDGTKFPGFTIPLDANGIPDETQSTTATHCLIPFEEWPVSIDPASGFTFNSNNDIAGTSLDGDLSNDARYIGGPWDAGYRAKLVHDALTADAVAKRGTLATMAALQDSNRYILAEQYLPYLSQAYERVRNLPSEGSPSDVQRFRDIYTSAQAPIDQAMTRLSSWIVRGANSPSGVETFYNPNFAAQREDAVANTIFSEFFRKLVVRIFADEGIEQSWQHDPDAVLVTAMRRFFEARNQAGQTRESLQSWNEATQESIYFDIRGTTPIESSDEIVLLALADTLTSLATVPTAPGIGGFGTTDMNEWVWGLRHMARFESLVKLYAGTGIEGVDLLVSSIAITPRRLPLMPELPGTDSRAMLPWFPRAGAFYTIDSGFPGIAEGNYIYSNGPVMRTVISLKNGVVTGSTVLPGGQSGVTSSAHFDDQLKLWLGNQRMPIRFSVGDVVAGAVSRETYSPRPL